MQSAFSTVSLGLGVSPGGSIPTPGCLRGAPGGVNFIHFDAFWRILRIFNHFHDFLDNAIFCIFPPYNIILSCPGPWRSEFKSFWRILEGFYAFLTVFWMMLFSAFFFHIVHLFTHFHTFWTLHTRGLAMTVPWLNFRHFDPSWRILRIFNHFRDFLDNAVFCIFPPYNIILSCPGPWRSELKSFWRILEVF